MQDRRARRGIVEKWRGGVGPLIVSSLLHAAMLCAVTLAAIVADGGWSREHFPLSLKRQQWPGDFA